MNEWSFIFSGNEEMTFRQIYTIMAAENTQPYDLFSQFALYPARGWIAPPLPVF